MKVVINSCFGGFSVSKTVYDKLGIKWDGFGFLGNDKLGIESDNYDAFRADDRLITAIEEIGERDASGYLASLQIVEIPDGIEWELNDYDGVEHIHQVGHVWG